MNTWSGIIMVVLSHITFFKPHNDYYESYFIDEKAEDQMVKCVCDITNLIRGIAIHQQMENNQSLE